MAKFQVKAMLLAPSDEGYTCVTDPKAYGDFKILETAYKYNNLDVMELVLNNYRYDNGAVEEHKSDAKTIIEYSGDGFCLLERVS